MNDLVNDLEKNIISLFEFWNTLNSDEFIIDNKQEFVNIFQHILNDLNTTFMELQYNISKGE